MAKDLFTEAQQQQVREAIQEAELNTSGEVKIHIERKLKEDVMDRASHVFEQLELHKTKLRNGVLIYLAIESKEFAILGDVGINQKVSEGFWDSTSLTMLELFKKGDFVGGLIAGSKEAGLQLKAHFPYQKGDINELSDDISFGKN
ncbi:TPM domain-containing protein [Vicingaceae bacterium]|nr:TPM domain-containing protein [Vicingaceae bacterium]MDB9963578.1 TPM domain-containing protein [Vicingaceae bacterium]MDC1451351.1 TPM domain-containing protein [Vicingaceae bacterium]